MSCLTKNRHWYIGHLWILPSIPKKNSVNEVSQVFNVWYFRYLQRCLVHFNNSWRCYSRASLSLQLYVSFMNSDHEERIAAVTRLNDCIRDVRTWLTRDMLNLNDEKTEVILFTSKHGLKSLSNITITVGEQQQLQSCSVRDLGVIYDQHLNMSQHVHSVCRTGYYHLKNIGRIRRYLTLDATKTLVHALVTSILDYCNSLLYGYQRIILRRCNIYRMLARVSTQEPVAAHTSLLFKKNFTGFQSTAEYSIRSCHTPIVRYTTNRRSTWVIYRPCHEREL